ncbi:hypothetical protein PPERSA_07628 [Pseudocohnilembus persalinus]|uniref:VLRF1 domain-containing protein n=1 Tax=Pseudocohnilembus persalinus TaxID=266149 RepID=A0A0V0QI84_PSEPJ|nr:hypothetical protein PPERSA_07628 [Pseudocohnilembus persalinus]|eukprot:KRX01983.1 hypothetical protein PPERSA_07628 [Pseudocohnilembus persalinus]
MVDKNLNYNKDSLKIIEGDEESKYEEFYKNNQEDLQSYDFTDMKSILQRQKKLLCNLKLRDFASQMESKQNQNYLNNLLELSQVCIILCSGGVFSMAFYDNKGKCFLHKSDSKYVVRKKAGQRQLAKDKNAGSQIQSMGSQIRRDQEKLHQEKVRCLIQYHAEDLQNSSIIFLQAPGINKLILLSEGEPLLKYLNKTRSLCISSKKANYTENERIYKHITNYQYKYINQKYLLYI